MTAPPGSAAPSALVPLLVRGAERLGFASAMWVRPAHEERRALEKKLDAANVAVVVLIDELDRVEDDEVHAVAQLVKAGRHQGRLVPGRLRPEARRRGLGEG